MLFSNLGMDVHLRGSAPVPGSKQDTTPSAFMLDILKRVHEIRDASQAEEAAETKGPSMGSVSNLISNLRHAPLATSRTIGRRRTPVQTSNGRRVLELGAGSLSNGSDARGAGGRHVLLLLLLLGHRVAALHLLGRRRLRVLQLLRLLVLLLHVGVLVDGRGLLMLLARDVGGEGVLV